MDAESPLCRSVVAELEGVLLKDGDCFPYYMLVAFEASGLIRFALLLALWPLIRLLRFMGMREVGHRLMLFVAVTGVREVEIDSVSRAVLPKFFADDVDGAAWNDFMSFDRRVVVTDLPAVMVERFVKEHLCADKVVGREISVNRFGIATGFFSSSGDSIPDRLQSIFGSGHLPDVGFGSSKFLTFCKERRSHVPFAEKKVGELLHQPLPVIFHDGRLVKRPTPATALLIILWFPIGIVLAVIRIAVGLVLPLRFIPYVTRIIGGELIVNGRPPHSGDNGGCGGGVLYVCTHRTLMDPVVLSFVLGRKIPAVTYSISRVSELLSPIPTVRLSRDRLLDAERIKAELSKGDLVVCPEGTTCREPFLLRFSALFAELTDRIVPVAMNYKAGYFFHATTARGWKGLDPIFFFMNPRPAYEVTVLNQLATEETCAAGKTPHEVANHVQRVLAAALGFQCTNFTRKDKYRLLAGNDGTVPAAKPASSSWAARAKKVSGFLLH